MKILGPYYIDLNKSVGEDFSEYEFDAGGIPLVRFNRSPQWSNNPVTVCQYALNQFNIFLKYNTLDSKLKFLLQANWLLKNYKKGPDDSAVWYYHLNIPFYRLKDPWISGMAQGEALSVLTRAFQLTEQKVYLDLADRVWKIFSRSVLDGGVMGNMPNGDIVIEEYPTQPCSCVLNGFILAIFGIYDYMRIQEHQDARELFVRCTDSLKNNIQEYDSNFWSFYDLYEPMRLTSQAYHRLHILLLRALYIVTQEETFLSVSHRWENYLKNPLCNIKWGIAKIKQRVVKDG